MRRIGIGEQRRRGAGIFRRGGGDQPEVIQKRAAEGRMKKMVAERVLLRQLSLGQIGRVVVAHRQAGGIGPGDEAVHLPAVDLQLLVIEAVDQIAGSILGPNEFRQIERAVGQIGGKSRSAVSFGDFLVSVDRLRQSFVRHALLIDLPRRGAGVGKAVGAGEFSVQAVEAPVLLIDDDDMVDALAEEFELLRGIGVWRRVIGDRSVAIQNAYQQCECAAVRRCFFIGRPGKFGMNGAGLAPT